MIITAVLPVVGIGLVLAGLTHVGLPRALGWRRSTSTGLDPLSALVIRMHVHFLGLFLVLSGVVTVVAAGTTGVVATTFFGGLAVLFAIRAVVEAVWVGRVVRTGPPAWRRLHHLALVVWPTLVVIFGLAAVR